MPSPPPHPRTINTSLSKLRNSMPEQQGDGDEGGGGLSMASFSRAKANFLQRHPTLVTQSSSSVNTNTNTSPNTNASASLSASYNQEGSRSFLSNFNFNVSPDDDTIDEIGLLSSAPTPIPAPVPVPEKKQFQFRSSKLLQTAGRANSLTTTPDVQKSSSSPPLSPSPSTSPPIASTSTSTSTSTHPYIKLLKALQPNINIGVDVISALSTLDSSSSLAAFLRDCVEVFSTNTDFINDRNVLDVDNDDVESDVDVDNDKHSDLPYPLYEMASYEHSMTSSLASRKTRENNVNRTYTFILNNPITPIPIPTTPATFANTIIIQNAGPLVNNDDQLVHAGGQFTALAYSIEDVIELITLHLPGMKYDDHRHYHGHGHCIDRIDVYPSPSGASAITFVRLNLPPDADADAGLMTIDGIIKIANGESLDGLMGVWRKFQGFVECSAALLSPTRNRNPCVTSSGVGSGSDSNSKAVENDDEDGYSDDDDDDEDDDDDVCEIGDNDYEDEGEFKNDDSNVMDGSTFELDGNDDGDVDDNFNNSVSDNESHASFTSNNSRTRTTTKSVGISEEDDAFHGSNSSESDNDNNNDNGNDNDLLDIEHLLSTALKPLEKYKTSADDNNNDDEKEDEDEEDIERLTLLRQQAQSYQIGAASIAAMRSGLTSAARSKRHGRRQGRARGSGRRQQQQHSSTSSSTSSISPNSSYASSSLSPKKNKKKISDKINYPAVIAENESCLEDAILKNDTDEICCRDQEISRVYGEILGVGNGKDKDYDSEDADGFGRDSDSDDEGEGGVSSGVSSIFGSKGTLQMVQSLLDRELNKTKTNMKMKTKTIKLDNNEQERSLWRRSLQVERIRSSALLRLSSSQQKTISDQNQEIENLSKHKTHATSLTSELVEIKRRVSGLTAVKLAMESLLTGQKERLNEQRLLLSRLGSVQVDNDRLIVENTVLVRRGEGLEVDFRAVKGRFEGDRRRFEGVERELVGRIEGLEGRIREREINFVDHAKGKKKRMKVKMKKRSGREEFKSEFGRLSDDDDDDESDRSTSSSSNSSNFGDDDHNHDTIKIATNKHVQTFLKSSSLLRTRIQNCPEALLQALESEVDTITLTLRTHRAYLVSESSKKREQQEIEAKEKKMCCVCLENEKSVILLPCKHLCLCRECGKDERIEKCPICRRGVDVRMDVFA